MEDTLINIIRKQEVLNSRDATNEQRKDASEWLTNVQKTNGMMEGVSVGTLMYFHLHNLLIPSSQRTPGVPSDTQLSPSPGPVVPEAAPSAEYTQLLSTLRGSPLELPVALFCAQTMALKLKQVLTKPTSMKESVLESWMDLTLLGRLFSECILVPVKKTLQICLGHAVVIKMALGPQVSSGPGAAPVVTSDVSDLLTIAVDGGQAVCEQMLSAAKSGAWDNVAALTKKEGDYHLIMYIAESLKLESQDPEGRLRLLPIQLATKMCDSACLPELLQTSVGSAAFDDVAAYVVEHIEMVEELCKAWQQMALNYPIPEYDHRCLVQLYPTIAKHQRALTEVLMQIPTHSYTYRNSVGSLTNSVALLSTAVKSKVRQIIHVCRTRTGKAKSNNANESDWLGYGLADLIYVTNTDTKHLIQLNVTVGQKLTQRIQFTRTVRGLRLSKDVEADLEKLAQQDKQRTVYQKQCLDVSLNGFFHTSQGLNDLPDWADVTRLPEDVKTPQELLATYQTLAAFSDDDESMEDFGEEEIQDKWRSFEALCCSCMVAYLQWLGSLVHAAGPLFAYGFCNSGLCVGENAESSKRFAELYRGLCVEQAKSSAAAVGLVTPAMATPGLTPGMDSRRSSNASGRGSSSMPPLVLGPLPPLPKVDHTDLEAWVQLALNYGLPERLLTVPERTGEELDRLVNGPFKTFGPALIVWASEGSLLDYDEACSSLNDNIHNALRDFKQPLAGGAAAAPPPALEMVLLRSMRATVYPFNFPELTAKLKREYCDHRDEVRRNLRSWIAGVDNVTLWTLIDKIAAPLLATPEAVDWRVVETIILAIANTVSFIPGEAAQLLKLDVVRKYATEHRAVLRQFLAIVVGLSQFPQVYSEEYLELAFTVSRAAFRVPQSDSCYPLASKMDHVGAVALSRVLSHVPAVFRDPTRPAVAQAAPGAWVFPPTRPVAAQLHWDLYHLTEDCVKRALAHKTGKSKDTKCFCSLRSLPSMYYCCARALSLSADAYGDGPVPLPPGFEPGNILGVSNCFIDNEVHHCLEALQDIGPVLEQPTPDQSLLVACAAAILEGLAIYVAHVLPPGMATPLNVTKDAGVVDDSERWGSAGSQRFLADKTAAQEACNRCTIAATFYPELYDAAAPYIGEVDSITRALKLLTNALLNSGLVLDPWFVEKILPKIANSPLLECVEGYLTALQFLGERRPDLSAFDELISARLNELIAPEACTLSKAHELAVYCNAVIRVVKKRVELFGEGGLPTSTDGILAKMYAVSLVGVLAYTHAIYRDSVAEKLATPDACLEVMVDLTTRFKGQVLRPGKGFEITVHNLCADTQLRAAGKGSAKSRESISSGPPSPVPVTRLATPQSAQTDLPCEVLTTVAIMALISAQDACPSVSSRALQKSLDLAPQVLDKAAVEGAAAYLTCALPFDTTGNTLPAVPYKWAASEDSLRLFIEAAGNANPQQWKKVIKGQCQLLNVAKRRPSRNSLMP
ncbi:hypothetical protein GNI_027170 [Gregarina niphandrodes]|uniref:Uncharacterized protein n=1 Tax=Gregarina niphandrodes TaxID=110365 RepID=A0A023BBA0_GRENI|nr:hypothetical protein GNI_027170 [Gregarina niphandrodes]EZG79307.1 hypothetical protein GNI_027170 [Gregarina niphandrodes]|eukprot:XP_011129076.1 hypothetical protein GNI_027170 [Gregarina niphandrodes]